jgi:uncharacterized protein (TIGR00251 family)
MSSSWCVPRPDGVRLMIQVVPNARKTQAAGVLEDALKIRLQAQPIEGRANEALIHFIATTLNVPRSAVTIAHGLTSKRKTVDVAVANLDAAEVERLLLASLGGY